jgi:O-antigen/teichoic acid export membrane protein
LIVGGLLGPASAAFYRVAATLADSAQMPTDLLARAFYPEIMRLDLKTKRPWKLMVRGAAIAAMVGVTAVLIVAIAGQALIELIFGAQFEPAYPVLIVLIVAPLLAMIAFPLEPMLYALGRSAAPLKSRIAATALYFAIVAPLSWRFGVSGAAAAFVLGTALYVTSLGFQLWRQYRRVRG